jgi:hypothetical protein
VSISGQANGSGKVGVQGIQTGGGQGSGVFGLGEATNDASFGGYFAQFSTVTSGAPYVGTAQFGQMNLTVTGTLAEDVGGNAGECKVYGGIVRSCSSYITAGNQDNAGGTGGIITNSYGYNVQQAMNIGTPGAAVNAAFHASDQGSGAGNYGILLDGVTHNDLGGGTTKIGYSATVKGPEIDPLAYGADPTGVIEATSFWISAKTQMEASGGKLICKGNYKLDRVPLNGIDYIEGIGDINGGGCIINVKTDAVFVTGVPTQFIAGVTIKNIDFIGGTSPIDLGTGNDVHIENLRIFNNTNCGVVLVFGERLSFVELAGTHTGQNGFATLCTGDKTKSLFSASISTTGGIARSHIRGIRELGGLNGGSNFTQYLWWGGFGVGGGADSTDATNFTCFYSCTVGYIWMDTFRFSRMAVLDMDHVGQVGTPETTGIKIASMDMASLSNFNPAFNTNFITTQADIGNLYRSSITDSAFCSCDNVTTFGLKLTGASGLQTGMITGNAGAFFVTSNPSHTTTLGNNWSLTNDIGGQHLVDISNLGITFHADHDFNDNSANTSSFTFRMGTGSGNSFNPFIISPTLTSTLNPFKFGDPSRGSSQTNNYAACETTFGTTTLNVGGTTTDTGLTCLPATAIIDAVVYRITTTITTAANFTVGDATTAARFCGAQSVLTSGTTGTCFVQADQTGAAGPRQTAASAVRITTNANPGAGAIRLIVYYHTWTPPTS